MRGRLIALALSLVLPVVAVEAAIRAFVPDNKFLDRKSDCYWIMRIKIRSDAHRGRRMSNVQWDEDVGWVMRPEYRTELESTNEHGMRGSRAVAFERTEGQRRVVVLGDSFTFGLGVEDDDVYTAQLEALEPDLEVLNMGINGSGTDQQLLHWERLGHRFQPDVVVIGVYVRNFHRNGLAVRELPKPRFYVEGDDIVLGNLPLPRPKAVLDDHLEDCRSPSRALDLAGYLWRRVRNRQPDGPFDERARIMHGVLERLRDSTSAAGAKLAILVVPDQEFRAFQDHERIERVVEGAAHELGVPVLNLTEPMLGWQAENEGVAAYDPAHAHWTPEGHAAAAGFIRDFLRREGML